MSGKDLMKQIVEMLIRAGKVPNNYTGEVAFTVNLNQGGVCTAKISVSESIK